VAAFLGLGAVGAILEATGVVKPAATHSAASTTVTRKPAKPAKPAKSATNKPTRPPIIENLKFSGQVKGTLTQGLNPRGISTKDTNPPSGFGPFNATQCTNSPSGYEVDLYGVVGGKRISLRITYASDDKVIGTTALTTKGTPHVALWGSDATVDKDYSIHGLNLEYPSSSADSTLTVAPDRRTGRMLVHLADMPYGQTVRETIRGSWRCA
jgi:hypothetical protein